MRIARASPDHACHATCRVFSPSFRTNDDLHWSFRYPVPIPLIGTVSLERGNDYGIMSEARRTTMLCYNMHETR